MKTTRRILVTIAAIALLPIAPGCSTFSPAGLAQLKDDPNCWDVDVQTLYGHGHVTRIGVVSGATVSKSSDGNFTITYPTNPVLVRPPVPIVTNQPPASSSP